MQISTETILSHTFFKGLPEHVLKLLAAEAMALDFKPGATIFRSGSPANRFYLLVEGNVVLEAAPEKRDDENKPALIETLGPGQVLGWSWLIPPYFWHFDARAITPVRAIFFYGSRLRDKCETDHDLGYELMKRTSEIMIERLYSAQRRLLEQA